MDGCPNAQAVCRSAMLTIRRKCGFRASSSATILFLLTRCSSNTSTWAFPLSRTQSWVRIYQAGFAMDNTEASPHKRSRESSCGPLACSRRVRRLFQHAFMSTDSNQQQPTSDVVSHEKGAKQPREEVAKKRRRPHNSYLKVVLDDGTMDRLHGFAVKLQNDVQSKLEKDIQSTSKDDEGTQSETPTTRKGLKFRSRSRTSLHLTLFFGGEVLCDLPPTELIVWHANVKARLEQSNFVLKSDSVEQPYPESSETEPTEARLEQSNFVLKSYSVAQSDPESSEADPTEARHGQSNFVEKSDSVAQSNPESSEAEPTDPQVPEELEQEKYWFRLTGLSLFPPRRNYLIVALLEASPSWHALHDEIRDVALNGDSESLRSITKQSKGEWIPHITLGNLYGGKKADLVAVQTMLQDFQLNDRAIENDTPEAEHPKVFVDRIVATRISMGGPIPGQVELDWNFCSENR